MAATKTWIWIIVGCLGVCFLSVIGLAGLGVYFVHDHIASQHATSAQALHDFDQARASFKGKPPLLELDRQGHWRETRPVADLPTSDVKPTDLIILAWNPDNARVFKVDLPFWLLHFGRRRVDIPDNNGENIDFDRLHVDVNELERIGPVFVLDYVTPKNERVLIWTECDR